MTSDLSALTASQLRKAAAIRDRIDTLQKELAAILGSSAAPAPVARGRAAKSAGRKATVAAPQRKRRFSKAARARLSASMKTRWAKAKATGKSHL